MQWNIKKSNKGNDIDKGFKTESLNKYISNPSKKKKKLNLTKLTQTIFRLSM